VKTDEIVRQLPTRPGYRLADYAEVGLPVYRITTRLFTQVLKKVPPIDEFLLRLLQLGIHRTEEMSVFLGLPTSFVGDALSELLVHDLVSLRPGTDRTQRLSLTVKGMRALEGAETFVPEEKTHTLEYDAILQQVVTYGRDRYMSGREIRNSGYKQIRPLLKRQVGISDIPLREVQKSFNAVGSRRDTKRIVLAVCEFYKRALCFLPAICVVYRAIEGSDIQVSFFIDGRPSPEHDQAFARADGVRLLRIDHDLTRFTEANESFDLILQEVESARAQFKSQRLLAGHPGNQPATVQSAEKAQPWSYLSPQQLSGLEQLGMAYLDAQDHYPLLLHSLKATSYRMIIITPFLHESIVTDDFVLQLEALLRRGCRIHIGYGMPDSETRKPSKSHTKVVERLEKLTLRYGQLVVKKVDTHAKVLLQDELLVALGSFNWLSFRGDPDRPFRDEQSVLITLPNMIEQKYQGLLQLFS
jgi:hypothetical protein